MATDWYVKGNTATASVTFYDELTGNAVNTTGTPTVLDTGSDGTTLSTTAVQTTGTTYMTTFVPTVLDTNISIKWTGTVAGATYTITNYADVVGSWPFTIAQLRAFRPEFADTTRYAYSGLLEARVAATKYLNNRLGTSVIPRYHSHTQQGKGLTYGYTLRRPFQGTDIQLPHWNVTAIRSVTIDGVTTVGQPSNTVLDGPMGIFQGLYVSPLSTLVINYEYGFPTVPSDGVRPLLMLTTDHALPNTANPRAISIDADTGFMTMKTAQPNGDTGIPDVDAFISRYGRRQIMGIA